MPRSLSGFFTTASKADNFIFGIAAEMDFSSGPVRLNTSPYDITIDTFPFLGVGNLGTVSAIKEESSLTAHGINLMLSGLDPTLVGIALNDTYQGRTCKLWVCLFDDNHALISAPYPVGIWRMDTLTVDIGDEGRITLAAQSAMAAWNQSKPRYYTDGDQKNRYPGDLFFEYLAPNLGREILWGRS